MLCIQADCVYLRGYIAIVVDRFTVVLRLQLVVATAIAECKQQGTGSVRATFARVVVLRGESRSPSRNLYLYNEETS